MDVQEDALAKEVQQAVAPETWNAAQGASIQQFNGWILVTQTPEHLKQVGELLEKMRKEKK